MDGLEAAQKFYGPPDVDEQAARDAAEPPPEYYELFNPPALSEGRAGGDDRTESYREHLRKRFGAGVPEEEVEAFERAYYLGREHPDQLEALITGLRAGVAERQREPCGGDGR